MLGCVQGNIVWRQYPGWFPLSLIHVNPPSWLITTAWRVPYTLLDFTPTLQLNVLNVFHFKFKIGHKIINSSYFNHKQTSYPNLNPCVSKPTVFITIAYLQYFANMIQLWHSSESDVTVVYISLELLLKVIKILMINQPLTRSSFVYSECHWKDWPLGKLAQFWGRNCANRLALAFYCAGQ